MTCTKPGCGNERAVGQRWCKACRAQDKRTRRAGNTGNTGNREQAGNGERGEQRAGTPLSVARQRIEDLEAEVSRLKRDLAAANAKALPALPAKTAAEALDAVGVDRSAGRGKVSLPQRPAFGKGSVPAKVTTRAPRCSQFCHVFHEHVR